MSKRRLTKQQLARIRERQARKARLAAKSPDAEFETDPQTANPLGPEQGGLVVARYRNQADIRNEDGAIHRCYLRPTVETVVVGDRVTFQTVASPTDRVGDAEDPRAGVNTRAGVVVASGNRLNALQRPDSFGDLKTLAANVSQVLVVIAPRPQAYANLIDRYLVSAELLGANAVIVLNKSDLIVDDESKQDFEQLLAPYTPLGYSVVKVQGKYEQIEALADYLTDHTSILVGQSGVGKTTLLNALVPEINERVGELSAEKEKGRHTTTTARLFDIPTGGSLIDSPGIREFGLQHLERADVERGFREFRTVIEPCRFRDCRHQGEPGCGLEQAAAENKIHSTRLASYRHIVGSLASDLERN
ncbi:MAG: small ribosomal subunit biogenesis GTPase RsgA [Pseudomonadota bacterium]